MRTILGRLADLGLPQLLKLLTSSQAEGVLELDTAAGAAAVLLRGDTVAGEIPPAVLVACRARAGTFRFRPGEVEEQERWSTVDEVVAALEGAAGEVVAAEGQVDPFSDLRDSLGEIDLPDASVPIAVVTADPRPYRAMEVDWQARGWNLTVSAEPRWPQGPDPKALVIHLPTSVTLVGQESLWLDLAHLAAGRRPPVPVLWVGGLTDPWLRHQAVMAGVSFVLPAPVGEVGETARWFRDEVTVLIERALSGRPGGSVGETEAFRDFFFALHVDATPAEVRASLLRVAGSYFATGLLLAVREEGFAALGSYGVPHGGAITVPRGVALLEDVVSRCLPARGEPVGELAAIVGSDAGTHLHVLPVLAGLSCVAAFVGARPIQRGEGGAALNDLMARSGSLLGL